MTRVHLLFRFAVFRLGLFLFELDDVETKLALDDVADFAGLQRIGGLLKFGDHVAMAKPTEVTAFVLAAVGGKLLRQLLSSCPATYRRRTSAPAHARVAAASANAPQASCPSPAQSPSFPRCRSGPGAA